jgi:hypothetical protein
MLRGWVDGELEPVSVLGRGVAGCELIPSEVKGSSEVMDCISANERKSVLDFVDKTKLLDCFSSLRVRVVSPGIRCKLTTELFQCILLEVAHVLSGAFDL